MKEAAEDNQAVGRCCLLGPTAIDGPLRASKVAQQHAIPTLLQVRQAEIRTMERVETTHLLSALSAPHSPRQAAPGWSSLRLAHVAGRRAAERLVPQPLDSER